MKIVKPSFLITSPFDPAWAQSILEHIERAGRKCYKSEGKASPGSASPFVRKLAQVKKHESVLEHAGVTVEFVCDRGVSHEIVRHRIASYSQESTRYCNYCAEKFDGHITLIHPEGLTAAQVERREKHYWAVQELYDAEIAEGVAPQLARGVLPTALKTEIVVTANIREWRHIFKMRAAPTAHPQMRELMDPLLLEFQRVLPELYDDLSVSAAQSSGVAKQ